MGVERRKKNLLNIIAMTSMTIFSLASVFAGTISWYSANQNYDNAGGSMPVGLIRNCVSRISFHAQVGSKSVTLDETTTDYYLFEKEDYAYITIDESNNVSNLTFNTESGAYKDWNAKPVGEKTATLSKYSLLSQDHPLLILFDVIPYTVEDPSKIILDFRTNSGYLGNAGTIQRTGNPLSSVVEFHSFGLTSALPSGGPYRSETQDYSDTYQYGAVRNITYDKKWADVQDNETVNFDADGLINLFSNLDGSGNPSSTIYTQIGVVMNFSIASLEYIYNRFLGEEVLESDIFFDWDWTMEV